MVRNAWCVRMCEEVTSEKPRAEYYIDDKGLHFNNNWDEILKVLC